MASRDSMDTGDLIGRVVDDRYKILDGMAAGSMGAVFKAERVPVGKVVAIKFLHAAFAKESEFKIRFERETRVMSKLAHPNCVSVVDFGVFEGAPYLVMDYVSGRTLRAIIDDAPLGPVRALGIVRQIAAGLAHAHAQDIVHRDIKPANIMITDEVGTGEHVRLLDFGLARLRVPEAGGRDATQTNMVVGTPNYMAPEQTIGGGTIDARTDIYAVGVVLFEMIAGERPYSAEDTLQLLGMHRAAPIPKLADRLDRTIVIPDGLQELLEKAMAKSPADRFQTAIELTEAIDEITGSKKLTPPPGTLVRRRAATPVAGSSIVKDRSGEAVASTMLGTTTDKVVAPRKRSSLAGIVLALIVLGGGAFAAWYAFGRGGKGDGKIASGSGTDRRSDGSSTEPVTGLWPEGSGSSGSAVVAGSGSETGTGTGSGSGSATEASAGSGSGSEMVAAGSGSGSGSASAGSASAGSGSGMGSGSGDIEMDPDPVKAEHVAPAGAKESEDEAEDAPATEADAEKRVPKAPVLVTTVHEAVLLIKEGKSEPAITSLRAIWKSQPNSAYIPFLLGNLYFDKTWWSIAMDHYRVAINKNGGYRGNPVLNRNIIRMLASPRTQKKAEAFIRNTIGKPAAQFLKQAAANEKNVIVRKRANELFRQIR